MTDRVFLLIDMGNSRIKWGLGRAGHVHVGEPFATAEADFARAWADLPKPDAIWVSTVAGPVLNERLAEWLTRRWGVSAHFVRSETRHYGVINGYDDPSRLGVDRWVALVGTRRRTSGPVCLADCGTAITVDVMNASGEHLGGVIAPGLHLMADSLAKGTQGVEHPTGALSSGFGRNTAAAVWSGALWAAAGLLEKVFDEAACRLGLSPSLIVTGGDGPSVADALSRPHELVPNLILEGLLVMAEEVE